MFERKQTEQERKIDRIKATLLDLLPTSEQNSWGQFPYILWHQIRGSLEEGISWTDMQIAYDSLYQKGRAFPEQDFSRSIIKRAYKNR